LDGSRKTSSSAAEYQSRGSGVEASSGRRAPGHVLPQEGLEGAHLVVEDRVLGEDSHARTGRGKPEAERVVAVAGGPIPDAATPSLSRSKPEATPVFDGAT
jgi:hypothetical protein